MTEATIALASDTIDVRALVLDESNLTEDLATSEWRAKVLDNGLVLTARECHSDDGSGVWIEITMPSIEDVEILLVDDPDRSAEWTLAIDTSERVEEISLAEAAQFAHAIDQARFVGSILPKKVRA